MVFVYKQTIPPPFLNFERLPCWIFFSMYLSLCVLICWWSYSMVVIVAVDDDDRRFDLCKNDFYLQFVLSDQSLNRSSF